MGGPKKKSLAQVEKQQRLQTEEQSKAGVKKSRKKISMNTSVPTLQDVSEKDLNELVHIKALTPFAVATKYNIKISAARDILVKLEKKKIIQKVASGRGLKIYKSV